MYYFLIFLNNKFSFKHCLGGLVKDSYSFIKGSIPFFVILFFIKIINKV